jgi:hypothetical protein
VRLKLGVDFGGISRTIARWAAELRKPNFVVDQELPAYFELLTKVELDRHMPYLDDLTERADPSFTPTKPFSILDISPSCWLKASSGVTSDALGRVSAWNDISGNSRHFAQATDAYKPLLTRSDSRENIYFDSDDVSLASVIKVGTTALDATTIKEDGPTSQHPTSQHYFYKAHTSLGVFPFLGESVRLQAKVKRGVGSRNIMIQFIAGGKTILASYNLGTGTIITKGSSVTASITGPDGDGYYTISQSAVAETTAASYMVYINMLSGTSTMSYAGDNTSTINIKNIQISRSSADTSYIACGSFRQIQGINNKPALHFDGVDDNLSIADFIGTGAETIFVVARLTTYGGSNVGRFLDNGKFISNVSGTNQTFRFSSDGNTSVTYAASSVATLGGVTVYAMTRLATGEASHYVDGSISGDAAQDSGTPVAASTSLYLGNRQALDCGFSGEIAEVITVADAVDSYTRGLVTTLLLEQYSPQASISSTFTPRTYFTKHASPDGWCQIVEANTAMSYTSATRIAITATYPLSFRFGAGMYLRLIQSGAVKHFIIKKVASAYIDIMPLDTAFANEEIDYAWYSTAQSPLGAPLGWRSWTPIYGGGDGMTFSSVTTYRARYRVSSLDLHVHLYAVGKTAKANGLYISATLPAGLTTRADSWAIIPCIIYDNSGVNIHGVCRNTGLELQFYKDYAGTTWGLGADRRISLWTTLGLA